MTKTFALAMFACLTQAFAPCSSSDWDHVPTSVLTVNLDSFDKKALASLQSKGLEIDVDDYLRFSVKGNPTTGFMWENIEDAANGLFEVCGDYEMDANLDYYTGVGGTFYFTLKGVARGDSAF